MLLHSKKSLLFLFTMVFQGQIRRSLLIYNVLKALSFSIYKVFTGRNQSLFRFSVFLQGETTILVTNSWNRSHLSWIFSKFLTFTPDTQMFSLKCAPLLPQCWATRILEHWDDCNTRINTGEGENHTSVSRFVTSVVFALGGRGRVTNRMKGNYFHL